LDFEREYRMDLWRFWPCSGWPLTPRMTPGPKIFIALYTSLYSATVYQPAKYGFSVPFSLGDIKAPILICVQWQCWHRTCRWCDIF